MRGHECICGQYGASDNHACVPNLHRKLEEANKRITQLEAALRPFAEECDRWDGTDYTPAVDDCSIITLKLRISTLARAKAALGEE